MIWSFSAFSGNLLFLFCLFVSFLEVVLNFKMSFLLKPLIGIVANGAALYLLTKVVEEISYTGGIRFFVVGGLVLGILNLIAKPLLKVISLPFVILTGGLFLIVINMVILKLLVYLIAVIQFRDVTLIIPDFSTYLISAVILGLINWAMSFLD